MKNRIWIAGILLSGLLQGCTSYTYETIMKPAETFDPSRSVQISVPANGRYDTTVYSQSGDTTVREAKAAFSLYAAGVTVYTGKTLDTAAYYVKPSILHWEDRATEWSGIPDRIRVQIEVYESGSRIAAAQFSGKSKWFTFGGDHPQDLLREPMKKVVESFYKQTDLPK